MGILLKTHKILWGRSGNRCAICKNVLIEDETATDDESVIGDEAHIVAKKIDGPRGISELLTENRDHYDNLILLCRTHHKIVDDQVNLYTVEKLKELKPIHEKWVSDSLDPNQDKDDLAYATYLDELGRLCDFDNWEGWTSFLMSNGQPSLDRRDLLRLSTVPKFIMTRFWPRKYGSLLHALANFKSVLNDLILVFRMHADDRSSSAPDDQIFTKKFYQIDEWNEERYEKLFKQFEYHVALVQDLTAELTRSANLITLRVRELIYPKFRDEQGKFVITSGPYTDMNWKTHGVEYSLEEMAEDQPYKGLKQFMVDRSSRDLNFGEGFAYTRSYFPGDVI